MNILAIAGAGVFFLLCASKLFAAPSRCVPVDSRFLRALRIVESGDSCRPFITGDEGRAIGPYQIHYAYWLDAVQFDPALRHYGSYHDCYREGYARAVVTAYLNRWCGHAVKRSGFALMARVHNGGPCGMLNPATQDFWLKVEKALKTQ